MQVRSQAIVLHKIRFNDQDSIVYLYSKDFAFVPYLVAGKRARFGRNASLWQPLSLVEYVADHKASRELQRIKEAHCSYAYLDIPFSPEKNAVSMFLAEVLYRVLRESEASEPLFEFLSQSMQLFDLSVQGVANFHLLFLARLCRFLGCQPNVESYRAGSYFDMTAGQFSLSEPVCSSFLFPDEANKFHQLFQTNYQEAAHLLLSRRQRVVLLEKLLEYYRIHLADFPRIKSLEILRELFD